ncbi:MAG: S8 family serine peptidase [Hyellaceae cyanobacterium CSU_1_1]|nr:S8 family serine peptidase [Pleurocapsa sp. CRU_1_2]NJR45674.1 S8 family serine peptidase [Hyellaceae cyanobacterium CSU_1_1]
MSDGLITAHNSLNQAVSTVKSQLSQFISNPNFDNQISLAFEQQSQTENYSTFPSLATPFASGVISDLSTSGASNDARSIINQWLSADTLPRIEIVSSAAINGAQGAYAATSNQIYLSQELLIEHQDDPDAVEKVLLEELGHSLSAQINPQDAPGDEGAIFSRLVNGEAIAPEVLATLKAEDDTARITLDGENIQIEQAREGINPAFDLIGLTDLRNDPNFQGIDGTGFDVVVIDTGLDATHPLLDDNYRFGFDYVDRDKNPDDLSDHGTHVSGIIGAENENIGVATDVGLIGLKAGEEKLDGQAIDDALQRVLDEVNDPDTTTNIVAVNLSLGDGFYTRPNQPDSFFDNETRHLIQELESAGVVVVAAAGNRFEGKPDSNGDIYDASGKLIEPNQRLNVSSPAIYSTISVGAVWQDNVAPDSILKSEIPGTDRIAAFSQRLNSDNFLFAPGAIITSTVPERDNGDLLGELRGTSQASPHVVGAVALLQELAADYDVRLTPEQVKDYLIDNADLINDGDDEIDTVKNTNLDYPRINIYQSAIALKEDLENYDLLDSVSQYSISDTNTNGDRTSRVSLDTAATEQITEDAGPLIDASDLNLNHFIATKDETWQIQVNASQESTDEPLLRLFKADGEEIVAVDVSDDAAKDRGNLLEVELEAGTEYYFEIDNYSENDHPLIARVTASESQDNYTVTIDDLPLGQTTSTQGQPLSDSLGDLPIFLTQSELGLADNVAAEQDEPISQLL